MEEESSSQSDSSTEEESDEEMSNSSTSESEKDNEKTDSDKYKQKAFDDENAKWLKPKSKSKMDLDLEDDDGEDLLPIEKKAQAIDMEADQEEEEAQEELKHTISTQTEIYQLPSSEEMEEERNGTKIPSPAEHYQRIQSILQVLSMPKHLQPFSIHARAEYLSQLEYDFTQYFGYLPELISLFMEMFDPKETLEFLLHSDKPRPIVLRTNTLKSRRKDLAAALMKRGVHLDPLSSWSKVGLKVYESTVPIGATPEYLAGYYMLQGASSMCPVLALDPQRNDVILDMCAAPGGKSSYISQILKNTGVVHSNDVNLARHKASLANLHRMGCHNVILTQMDGRAIAKAKPNAFNRVLLDAPCSGLGVISRDPTVKIQRTLQDIKKCADLQKRLILAAIDASKDVVVYSTCSISIQENEEVVEFALKKRNVKLVDTGLSFGNVGFTRFNSKRFHSTLNLTRRFYPHVHNMDGFYVAKFVKLGNEKYETIVEQPKRQKEQKQLTEPVTKKPKLSKRAKKKKKVAIKKEQRQKKHLKSKKDKLVKSPHVKVKKVKTNANVTKPRRIKVVNTN